jgi:hypothetical protein
VSLDRSPGLADSQHRARATSDPTSHPPGGPIEQPARVWPPRTGLDHPPRSPRHRRPTSSLSPSPARRQQRRAATRDELDTGCDPGAAAVNGAAARPSTTRETLARRPLAGRAPLDPISRGVRVWPSVLSRIVAAAGLASRSLAPFPSPRSGPGSAGRSAAFLALVGSPNHIPQGGIR